MITIEKLKDYAERYIDWVLKFIRKNKKRRVAAILSDKSGLSLDKPSEGGLVVKRMSHKMKEVNHFLLQESLSKLSSDLMGSASETDYRVMKRTFKWFDPSFLTADWDLTDTKGEAKVDPNVNPIALRELINYSVLTHLVKDDDKTKYDIWEKYTILHVRSATFKECRGMPFNSYPVSATYLIVHADEKKLDPKRFFAYYNKRREWDRSWVQIQRGDRPAAWHDPKINNGKAWFGGLHNVDKQFSAPIQLALGMQKLSQQEWHVDIGYPDLPKMRIPVSDYRLAGLFKLRDIPEGESRRKALTHWVSRHKRLVHKNGDEEKLVNVVRHMRGQLDFGWEGLNCQVLPSKFDVKKLSIPLSDKSKTIIHAVSAAYSE